MPLIKNMIPILEYDTDSEAVIMPGHHTDFHFADRAVIIYCGFSCKCGET